MGNKTLKNRTQFTSTLTNELHKDLRDLSRTTKVPISRLLDEAVQGLLEERTGNTGKA